MNRINPYQPAARELLAPGAKANSGAATSAWVDVRDLDGAALVVVQVGVVTAGQVALKIREASDGTGTGAADVASLTTVTTANDPLTQAVAIVPNRTKGFIQLEGTVTTGPVDLGAAIVGVPRNP